MPTGRARAPLECSGAPGRSRAPRPRDSRGAGGSLLSTAAQAGERRPRPQLPAGPGGSPRDISINFGTPLRGPGLPTWKRGTLSADRFRTGLWELRPPAHPQDLRRGRRGRRGLPAPGSRELSPESPARRCELSLRARCSGVSGVRAQTGIIIASGYRWGRGGPERRARRPKETREPMFWPQILCILIPLPYFYYPRGS